MKFVVSNQDITRDNLVGVFTKRDVKVKGLLDTTSK